MNKLMLGIGLVFIMLAVVGGMLFVGGTLSGRSDLLPFRSAPSGSTILEAAAERQQGDLPNFVYNSALSLQAYKLALGMSDNLSWIACYCDCGRASQHGSLKDCYFKPDGKINDHASNCDVCQDEVIDLERWRAEGKSLREIRGLIDARYRDYGEPTDTPLP